MIEYRTSPEGITPAMLRGFFQGWKRPHGPEDHLRILLGSDRVVLAFDPEAGRVVGFATAITDGVHAAFLPLLEVLPEYRGRGIGSECVRRMLRALEGIQAVDLSCDPPLQPFYERFGMLPLVGMGIRNY